MGIYVEMRTIGVQQMVERLRALGKKVPKSAAATLNKFANVIITDAKQNYVPVDDGPLRSSGTVEPVKQDGNVVSVRMGFGDGASAGYALAVHEHLSDHSPPSWKKAKNVKFGGTPQAGPKYLERPFLAATAGGNFEQKLADGLVEEWSKD